MPNWASANRERKVAASGETPLDVMIKSMRHLALDRFHAASVSSRDAWSHRASACGIPHHATYLAATLPLMHGAAIISIAAFSGFAIVYAPTLARPVRAHPLGEGILYSGLRTDRSGAGNVEGMSSVVSRYRRPPGIGTLIIAIALNFGSRSPTTMSPPVRAIIMRVYRNEFADSANSSALIKIQSLENDWRAPRDRPCGPPHEIVRGCWVKPGRGEI